jgi:riboflavin kinase/FMN adenylyltransferase
MSAVVVPGNHDGVHVGHRALLARARAETVAARDSVIAYTFDPHPATVLGSGPALETLTTIDRRRQLLLGAGADEVVVQPFDRSFAALSPDDFVQQVLRDRLDARALVVGPDYRFGRDRAGDVGTLRAAGIAVHLVPPVEMDGARVSSTGIRDALRTGDVAVAARWLGRLHDLDGTVVAGDRIGRTLGFPTLNLELDDVQRPADGIYAVAVRRLDRLGEPVRLGAASIGVRPQFEAGRSFEVYVLDFDDDWYGARVRVGMVERIRPEQKFPSVEDLVARIRHDVVECRRVLETADRELWRWI